MTAVNASFFFSGLIIASGNKQTNKNAQMLPRIYIFIPFLTRKLLLSSVDYTRCSRGVCQFLYAYISLLSNTKDLSEWCSFSLSRCRSLFTLFFAFSLNVFFVLKNDSKHSKKKLQINFY